MNPQVDSTGLGLPQPGSDASQLPAIHAPQTFHAPDTAAPQFSISTSPMPAIPTVTPIPPQQAAVSPVGAIVAQPAPNPNNESSSDRLAAMNAQFTPAETTMQEDVDTPFDEEWVVKAKEVVGRTHADPFLQSRELSKLKAAYIKARYNKDIKVSED